jgi:two-component system NarL family response regulator
MEGGAVTQQPVRILLADDHPVVLQGLVAMLSSREVVVVATATNGMEAVNLYRAHRPDVTILDLRMPVMTGFEALKQIRADDPSARVIVLTTFDREDDVYRALQSGARAYVLKEAGSEELMLAVLTVHAGRRYMPPSVSSRMAEHIESPALTRREIDVLELAAGGKKNKEIGLRLGISEGTVKGHFISIFAKLPARDRTEAVTIALRRGMIYLEPIDN